MGKKLNILAFIIIGTVGTLWHFFYDWSNYNDIIGVFAPVSESIWEHQKLIFYPTLIYSVFEYFAVGKRVKNYIPAVTAGIIAGIISMISLFYTYSGVLGFTVEAVNIAIFFVGLFITLAVRNCIIKNGMLESRTAVFVSLFLLVLLAVLFGVWSFNPPSIGLFTPPLDN